MFQNILTAQNYSRLDSITLFSNNHLYLDSILLKKQTDVPINYTFIFSIIEKKLSSGHYLSQQSIEGVISWLTYNIKSNCDSNKIYLIERLIKASTVNQEMSLLLLHQKAVYLRENSCYFEKYQDSLRNHLIKTIALEYKIKLENDLSLLCNRNEVGRDYLRLKNYKEAEDEFLEILSYPFYSISGKKHYDYMDKCREQYRKAGIGILEARRGSLTKLEYTFFVPAMWDFLEPIKKRYIEEMGGIYKHPSVYDKPTKKQ